MADQLDLFSDNSSNPDGLLNAKNFREPASGSTNTNTEDYSGMEKLYELSADAYSAVANARMDDSLNKTCLPLYIQKVLDAVQAVTVATPSGKNETAAQLAAREAADRAASDRGDPLVRIVLESAQRVGREIHRLMGLLRFNPRNDGIWLARCAPDNSILHVFAWYFMRRFGEVPWVIIDEKRGLALVRLANEEPVLGPLSAFPFLSELDLAEDDWEELWRSYHKSVNIENRKNPALQIQLMPRRYWKYLPEINRNSTET